MTGKIRKIVEVSVGMEITMYSLRIAPNRRKRSARLGGTRCSESAGRSSNGLPAAVSPQAFLQIK